MKVLHVLDTLPRGGKEQLTLNLCKFSKQFGIDITFVSLNRGQLFENFQKLDIETFELLRNYPVDLKVILKLRKILKQKKIQIIHSHQAVEAIHSYLASFGLNISNVITFHGYKKKLKDDLIIRFLINRVEANIVPSISFINILENKGHFNFNKRPYVIPNGIDFDAYSKNSKTVKKGDKHIIIGTVGNFREEKNQLTILKSIPHIINKIRNVKFVFVGGTIGKDDYYLNKCKQYCVDNNLMQYVSFLGERQDVSQIIQGFDFFVMSSIQESFGLAVIEAMASGIPTILSNIPPFLEISQNGRYAHIFDVRDPFSLGAKLINLIKYPFGQKEILNIAKNHIEQKYSIQTHIKNLMGLYGNLIQKSKY